MSNKSRKNKSSQSPKQEPERASEKAMRESEPEKKTAAPPDKQGPAKEKTVRLPSEPFSFEDMASTASSHIRSIVDDLEAVGKELNTETIFGIPAARFQAFADRIKKYPGQLEKKAAKERRLLTQTETKEEKKEKKAKVLREKIQAMQTKLAAL